MSEAAKHTPVTMDENGVLSNASGKQIAAVLPGEMREFGKFIVRAVNCHADMLAALKEIVAEAEFANNVIAHNRDGAGQGRVKVATSMHRIAQKARAAISRAESTLPADRKE